MTPTLSLVVPAYNEADRLGPYLTEIRAYLDVECRGSYEVLVVDDGSSDDTAGLVSRVGSRWQQLRLMRHTVNRGKGAAVRTGVLATTGRRVLFADADGATPIVEESRLAAAIHAGAMVACGSRVVPGEGVTRDRNFRRAIMGGFFSWLARRLIGVTVRDTQCGFKMFVGDVGRALFAAGQELGYLFDLEVLALAARSGYPVVEVPVSWSERAGSKVRLFRDSYRMFRGLWRLRGRLRGLPTPVPVPLPADRKAA